MQNLEEYFGIKVGRCNVILRYADDIALFAENKEDLKQLFDVIEKQSIEKRLELNSKNTKVMVVSENNECPQINIFIKGNKVKQRDQFKYLGTLTASDGHNNTEIASRIAQAKKFSENEINTNKP